MFLYLLERSSRGWLLGLAAYALCTVFLFSDLYRDFVDAKIVFAFLVLIDVICVAVRWYWPPLPANDKPVAEEPLLETAEKQEKQEKSKYTVRFEDKEPTVHVGKADNIFVWRTDIWKETQELASQYPVEPSEKIVYDPAFVAEKRFDATEITVENIDTIVSGRALQDAGLNPLLLNFADDRFAGGSVETGSGAQEESLFRRTNLCQTLLQDEFYPILDNEAVYSPGVTVFRDTEDNDNIVLDAVWQSAFIALPGIHNPQLVDGQLSESDSERLKQKIELIMQIGYKKGHDALVLGALGCGAWHNPPQHVAQLFKEVLANWTGRFKKIVFACLEVGEGGAIVKNRRSGPTNFEVFSECFSSV